MIKLIRALQPRDQIKILGNRHAHRGIHFEVTDPLIVAHRTPADNAQSDKSLETPADGRRRTKVKEQQALDRQRTPTLRVKAYLRDEQTIKCGLQRRKILLLEGTESSKFLKHMPSISTICSVDRQQQVIIMIESSM